MAVLVLIGAGMMMVELSYRDGAFMEERKSMWKVRPWKAVPALVIMETWFVHASGEAAIMDDRTFAADGRSGARDHGNMLLVGACGEPAIMDDRTSMMRA